MPAGDIEVFCMMLDSYNFLAAPCFARAVSYFSSRRLSSFFRCLLFTAHVLFSQQAQAFPLSSGRRRPMKTLAIDHSFLLDQDCREPLPIDF
jgi:hypothetical protein